ncbi:hypothetical protein SAMD00019534_065000 [Acytostelium subglobosum LB1]|uniref:hypothetical protein n=1 Tax=Acytostelium subglobosum LB1 TaxID=1410327 RepID=UPI000644A910|nr:hypothetical protein SAMD00019534_065000 [Acytostelium subglobosum LB1]GAM23325.1 hypothetical protein SAMD00019534_065000 [Acytostelium subglobosum LB1]|eukprot:XP_012753774.1 hypothetical protein SAMD00019534_065000 [Acytostelium subglobosum LB1]
MISDNNQQLQQVVYFTRHGNRADWNNPDWAKIAERVCDPPLSDIGLNAASELGVECARNSSISPSHSIKHIIVSPMIRCIQTARAIAKQLGNGITLKVEPGLIDWHPDYEIEYLTTPELSALYPELIDINYIPIVPLVKDKAETVYDLFKRSHDSIDGLLQRYSSLNEAIIVVTHACNCVSMTRHLLKNEEHQVGSGVCHLTKLVRNANGGEWTVELNGSTSHLTQGEQHTWTGIFPKDP